jgi:hypothetical protein
MSAVERQQDIAALKTRPLSGCVLAKFAKVLYAQRP